MAAWQRGFRKPLTEKIGGSVTPAASMPNPSRPPRGRLAIVNNKQFADVAVRRRMRRAQTTHLIRGRRLDCIEATAKNFRPSRCCRVATSSRRGFRTSDKKSTCDTETDDEKCRRNCYSDVAFSAPNRCLKGRSDSPTTTAKQFEPSYGLCGAIA